VYGVSSRWSSSARRRRLIFASRYLRHLARGLQGALRQTENHRAPWRQIDKRRRKVDGEAANPSCLTGEFELRVALGQCELCPLAVGNIDLGADSSEGPPNLII
jgi:hypothetical protein